MSNIGIVAHYKLNETSGTSIADSAGTNIGTSAQDVSNMTAVGVIDKALTFNGTTDKIAIAADSAIDAFGKTALSISAWINPASDGENDTGRVVDKRDAATGGTIGYYLLTEGEAGNLVVLHFNIKHATTDMQIKTNAIAPINTWSHVVGTYNEDGDGKGKLYLDGILQILAFETVGNVIGAPLDDSAIDLTIGNATEDTTRTFDGTIDNVMIFDRAINAEEVKLLYNAGHGTEVAAEMDISRRYKNKNRGRYK